MVGAERRLCSLAHDRHASAAAVSPPPRARPPRAPPVSSSHRRAVNSARLTDTPSAALTSPSAPEHGRGHPRDARHVLLDLHRGALGPDPHELAVQRAAVGDRARREPRQPGALQQLGQPRGTQAREHHLARGRGVRRGGLADPQRVGAGVVGAVVDVRDDDVDVAEHGEVRRRPGRRVHLTQRGAQRGRRGRTCSVRLRCSSATR